MTAYAAAAAGIKVVLLEAATVGQGGSGHGSGLMAGEATTSFLDLQASAGRRIARAQFDHLRRAVLDLAAAAPAAEDQGRSRHCSTPFGWCRQALPPLSFVGKSMRDTRSI